MTMVELFLDTSIFYLVVGSSKKQIANENAWESEGQQLSMQCCTGSTKFKEQQGNIESNNELLTVNALQVLTHFIS